MVAGIGCRAGVSGEQVEAAIAAALAALRGGAAARRAGPTAIATPAAKSHEPGIQAAAAARGLPLLAISQPDLEAANPATVTRSAQSMAAMNVHSVAEAAALAGAAALANAAPANASLAAEAGVKTTTPLSPNPTPRLLQPRVAVGPVTCALADMTPP
jgi:cobalt-precorrin 5A hydrolase